MGWKLSNILTKKGVAIFCQLSLWLTLRMSWCPRGRLWVCLDELCIQVRSALCTQISHLSVLTGHEFMYCWTVSKCMNCVSLGWYKTEGAFCKWTQHNATAQKHPTPRARPESVRILNPSPEWLWMSAPQPPTASLPQRCSSMILANIDRISMPGDNQRWSDFKYFPKRLQ